MSEGPDESQCGAQMPGFEFAAGQFDDDASAANEVADVMDGAETKCERAANNTHADSLSRKRVASPSRSEYCGTKPIEVSLDVSAVSTSGFCGVPSTCSMRSR